MSFDFCGIPCTPPNRWELQPVHLANESTDQRGGVVPHLRDLEFYVDVYNEHHACCWPRTLLDTHLGSAAAAVGRATEGLGKATVFTNHVIHVTEQLFAAQQLRLPRIPHARRIVYHNGVPPVLRGSKHGDPPVYILQGSLELHHRCQQAVGEEGEGESRKEGMRHTPRRRRGTPCTCRYTHQPDALARDVFPPFVVMAPSNTCDGFVDSEAGSAMEAGGWRAQPLVLALQSVTRVGESHGERKGSTAGVGDGVVWSATYSSFTWVCSPLGNAHVPSVVRKMAPRSRPPRGGSHAPTTVPSSSSLPNGRGRNRSASNNDNSARDVQDCHTDCSPLQLSFDLYGTVYTSRAAKQHVLGELETSHLYTPYMTNTLRFGFNGGGAGSDGEESEVATEQQLQQASERRPRQLMRLLDTALPSSALDSTGVSPRPQKAPRRDTTNGSQESSAAEEEEGRGSVRADPCVRLTFLGRLRTVDPIARELCTLPRSTTLVSVLRRVAQPAPVEREVSGTDGSEAAAVSSSRWPLQVCRGDPSTPSEAVVELSSLSNLRDLAEALRQVHH